jgi:phage tail sheath protein FI
MVGSGSAAGSFTGGKNGAAGFDALGNVQGTFTGRYNFYDSISDYNSQGYALSTTAAADGGSAYMDALNLLNNGDEYDINLILLPGVIDNLGGGHTGIITKAIDVCENRSDCFLIYDTVQYGTTAISTVTAKAETRDSNYAATYWPWVQINENQTGKNVYVPPSTVLAGIYAFNDKVAAPWFAPAGLNRGGLDTVIQAERKLTHANRDDLYESNVNPIATFPGQGVCVWGQKTLQKKASALDRVNVRRLMIKVKKFIAASSRFLVFEQNTTTTRQRFLNIANPYLEQVQSQSGLNAFRVVMDDTNNTPDIVDRNILFGQIFLQPTRTAEFIVLDFTIQPTGATFPE